jgi:hypothetical protein
MGFAEPKSGFRNLEEYVEYIRGLSLTDLEDIACHVDKGNYPERYQAVIDLISQKRLPSQKMEDTSRNNKTSSRVKLLSKIIAVQDN